MIVAQRCRFGEQGPGTRSRAGGSGSGDPVMRLLIPRLGGNWSVVQGVTPADMAGGPGLYPGMAPIGQVGNTGIAGHRWIGVFWDLDELTPGDQLTVQTRDRTYTYQVDSTRTVLPTDVWVLGPHPLAGAQDQSVLTLTTCTPKGENAHRLVVFSRLVASAARS